MSLKSGHRIVPVIGKEQDQQVKDFKFYNAGTIRLQPDGWFMTAPYISIADKVFDFEFRPTDVVVMTYPKCGTTWTQEIVWTLINNPKLNHPQASLPAMVRVPFLEFDFIIPDPGSHKHPFADLFKNLHPDKDPNDGIMYQMAKFLPDPRQIKTHLPFSLSNSKLLDTCKVVYVARNPKDALVSYHHHSRLLKGYDFCGSFDSFINHFVNDTLQYSPYWTHIKEAWDRRNHPNLHFIYFEDLKANPKEEIIRLQKFLGTKLTDQQIDNVVKYTSFSEMKSRDDLFGDEMKLPQDKVEAIMNVNVLKEDGGFFRKGATGDWKNKMTEEQARILRDWIKKNVQDFGPDFKYFE